MAAEIIRAARGPPASSRGCFNEAAANGRGNPFELPSPAGRRGGFNEAAANGRGNPAFTGSLDALPFGFNEAAANGRGNRKVEVYRLALTMASMRPRRMAAEIAVAGPVRDADRRASMRPRRMAAEIAAGGASPRRGSSALQ